MSAGKPPNDVQLALFSVPARPHVWKRRVPPAWSVWSRGWIETQKLHGIKVLKYTVEGERKRKIALVRSASLAYEDASVFMSMAHGTGYGTKVIKPITWTTRTHQCDSMTITVRVQEGFGCEDHHVCSNDLQCIQLNWRPWMSGYFSFLTSMKAPAITNVLPSTHSTSCRALLQI